MSDGVLSEVNFIETLEVYSCLRMLKAWKHCFRRAEAMFFDAKSCESIVSVVPVCFAFLETLFLCRAKAFVRYPGQAITREF